MSDVGVRRVTEQASALRRSKFSFFQAIVDGSAKGVAGFARESCAIKIAEF